MRVDLLELLRKVSPSGPTGFEGLIAALLGSLTGTHFQLAIAGSQAGRDMSARSSFANVIAVECKRYKNDTDLSVRELLGEMTQAMATSPDLDLWVLVASREIPSQLHEELHQLATERGIGYLAISTGDGTPSTLEVLCAHAPQIITSHPGVQAVVVQENIEFADLEAALNEIRQQPQYQSRVLQLQESFLSPLLGYANWRVEQNRWFLKSVQSADEARAAHGQLLNVEEPGTLLIKRKAAWSFMDEWLENWKTTSTTLALLGEEGDGKTWSVASWLANCGLTVADFPAIVFLTSTNPSLTEHGTIDPSLILANAISRCLPNLTEVQVQRRLRRWLERPTGQNPLMILVLDGINERREASWWRGILEQLPSHQYRQHIAVITTCRNSYWERNFGPLTHLPVSSYLIPPYNDDELNLALRHANLQRAEIQETVLPLIRKPRYFDLMVRHHQHIAESGDFTVARLIYEDWRDRYERKQTIGLTDEDFQNVIRQLAESSERRQTQISPQTVANTLPLFQDQQLLLQELQTGGVLQPSKGKFRVNKQVLIYGFGLLLVDEVEQSAPTEQDYRETIAQWLEPHAEMDLKASICEFAALHALRIEALPQEAKVALLEAWIESQNPTDTTESNLTAYLPCDPQAYVALAEALWSNPHENRWAQDILMDSFIHHFGTPQLAPILHQACERWLGFFHIQGAPSLRRKDCDQETLTEDVGKRLGGLPHCGPLKFLGYPLTGVDNDGLLQLGRVALALISHYPRPPFVRALTVGCLAEDLMGRAEKYELFAWVIRTSPQNLQDAICAEAECLLKTNHEVAARVADRLLSFEGSATAEKIRDKIPETIFPPRPMLERHRNDPCTSGFAWSTEDCIACLARTDLAVIYVAERIAPHCINPNLPVPQALQAQIRQLPIGIETTSMWVALGLTSADYDFQTLEPLLAAYSANAIAAVIRSLAQQIAERREMPQRQLAIHLVEHYLVLTGKAREFLQEAWEDLLTNVGGWTETEEVTEYYLFKILLAHMDGDQQLAALLRRPEKGFNWLDFEKNFLPLTQWELVQQQLTRNPSKTMLNRLLWFLSAQASTIPAEVLHHSILPLNKHSDSYIRSLVLEIMAKKKDTAAINTQIKSDWGWQVGQCEQENSWGSRILCEHGTNLPFDEICRRVQPNALGYAIKCRGTLSGEVQTYAELLHQLWLKLAPQSATEQLEPSHFNVEYNACADSDPHRYRMRLADDLSHRSITFLDENSTWGGTQGSEHFDLADLSENAMDAYRQNLLTPLRLVIEQQHAAGNLWFGREFRIDTLDQVIKERPDLVDEWIAKCSPLDPAASHYIHYGNSFYAELCCCLLLHQIEKGLLLYWRLQESLARIRVIDGRTKIDLLDFSLFKSPMHPESEKAWQQKLEQCRTDQELMTVALLAEFGTAQAWLGRYVEERVQVTAPLEKARAVVLLGFLEPEEAKLHLQSYPRPLPENWVGQLLQTAQQRQDRNHWAKHWFTQFLTHEEDVGAWAAYRLLLRCVDRRFWFWREKLETTVDTTYYSPRRKTFLYNNWEGIKRAIEKNEKDLKEQFLGQKLMQGQVWPWM